MTDDRRGSLLEWQWSLYPAGHRDRRNLLVHALTVPVFQVGTVALATAPFLSGWLAALGFGAMAGAMVMQGRTHRREQTPPVPFRGPGDVVARILAEQWLTFPRYVASGAFGRAWRAASPSGLGGGSAAR
ncbi:MAG TPA: terminase [Myxococcaceae bacterium]|nr:terminase [Myxococcaceae bacterium]